VFVVYVDLQIFDIIVFAGIAVFLVFRLRNVLGKRTGFEKKPNNNVGAQPTRIKETTANNVPELEEKISKLKTAYVTINDFDHKKFLEGAKRAFEIIINAFNKGDKKTLKKLVTEGVFKSFEEAIDAKNINPDYQFYSLNIEKIEKVFVEGSRIKICVKFISEQFKNNDENTVVKKQDSWTFEKTISSKDPNWLLSST
jgi:predicted lipid-binding transport protein (Tim44 family)|tara:strand:- start:2661 stop:3254 length:594 start_codon:yes stop_codon:yes gene_type:complete